MGVSLVNISMMRNISKRHSVGECWDEVDVNKHDRLVEGEVVLFDDVFDAIDVTGKFVNLGFPIKIHIEVDAEVFDVSR